MMSNRALVIYALKQGAYTLFLSPEQKDDKELALVAVTRRKTNYRDLSDRLKGDTDVLRLFLPQVTLLEAVGQYYGAPDAVIKAMLLA